MRGLTISRNDGRCGPHEMTAEGERMTLQSMTGFARGEGTTGRSRWVWELRSVNGKGLDLRMRLAPGHERLEVEARSRIGTRFSRGNMQLSLSVQTGGTAVPVVNEEALSSVLDLIGRLGDRIDAARPTFDGLLNLPGILELRQLDETDEERAAFDAEALAGLDRVLDDLARVRAAEGAAMKAVLERHLEGIEAATRRIDNDPSRTPERLRERLEAQVALLADGAGLDSQRLHMEAALLAAKADLREEIDRLHAHAAAARDLLAKDGPVGRRLDFLAQEFNREANTICSKSNAASVTAEGMELKLLIDQLREQVQNLE